MGKATRSETTAGRSKPSVTAKSKSAAPAKAKSLKSAPPKTAKPVKSAKSAPLERKASATAKKPAAESSPAKPVAASPTRSTILVKKSPEATARATKSLPQKPSAMQSPKLHVEKGTAGRQSMANGTAKHPEIEDAPARAKLKPMNKKARAELSSIVLPAGYRPTESEPFMNPMQRVYFRNKLQTWKEDIIKQNRETLQVLHEDTLQHADLADRATSETDRALELRARDRQRKLVAKIDAALARIEDGSYGYCEETGEPISLKRLDARPIATLSVEAQERHERREKVYREE